MASRMFEPAKGTRSLKFTLKPSKQTCLALAGLILVGLLSGTAFYVWQSGQLDALQQRVNQNNDKVASSQRVAKRLDATKAEYTDAQKQLQNLETSVTAGEYVPTLLKQMEGLAKSVSLQVGSVRPKLEPAPSPPADKEAQKAFVPWPYDKIHIDMEVRGTYWNVAKLLYKLTTFPKIMAVETVGVQSSNATAAVAGAPPQLTVTLKLTGFIFPNDGAAASPAASSADSGLRGALSTTVDSAKSNAARLMPPAPKIVTKVGAHARQATEEADPAATPPPKQPEVRTGVRGWAQSRVIVPQQAPAKTLVKPTPRSLPRAKPTPRSLPRAKPTPRFAPGAKPAPRSSPRAKPTRRAHPKQARSHRSAKRWRKSPPRWTTRRGTGKSVSPGAKTSVSVSPWAKTSVPVSPWAKTSVPVPPKAKTPGRLSITPGVKDG